MIDQAGGAQGFPAPVVLGPRCYRWRTAGVAAFVAQARAKADTGERGPEAA